MAHAGLEMSRGFTRPKRPDCSLPLRPRDSKNPSLDRGHGQISNLFPPSPVWSLQRTDSWKFTISTVMMAGQSGNDSNVVTRASRVASGKTSPVLPRPSTDVGLHCDIVGKLGFWIPD